MKEQVVSESLQNVKISISGMVVLGKDLREAILDSTCRLCQLYDDSVLRFVSGDSEEGDLTFALVWSDKNP